MSHTFRITLHYDVQADSHHEAYQRARDLATLEVGDWQDVPVGDGIEVTPLDEAELRLDGEAAEKLDQARSAYAAALAQLEPALIDAVKVTTLKFSPQAAQLVVEGEPTEDMAWVCRPVRILDLDGEVLATDDELGLGGRYDAFYDQVGDYLSFLIDFDVDGWTGEHTIELLDGPDI